MRSSGAGRGWGGEREILWYSKEAGGMSRDDNFGTYFSSDCKNVVVVAAHDEQAGEWMRARSTPKKRGVRFGSHVQRFFTCTVTTALASPARGTNFYLPPKFQRNTVTAESETRPDASRGAETSKF